MTLTLGVVHAARPLTSLPSSNLSPTPTLTMADKKIATIQAKLQESSRDFQKLESGACRGCAPHR